MLSLSIVFLLFVSCIDTKETSYFEIMKDAQLKLSVAPNLPKVNGEVSHLLTQVQNELSLDFFSNFINEVEKGQSGNSSMCLNDMGNVLNSAVKGERWALEVLDSFGKIQSGILMLNVRSPGFFDECKNVGRYKVFGMIPQNVTFVSQYCSLNVLTRLPISPVPLAFSFGLCVSERCSEIDLDIMIYKAMQMLRINSSSIIPYVTCQKNHPEMDSKAVAALVFAGFYALLVTISTVVDVLSTWMVKNNLFDSASTSTNADVLRYAHKTSSEETPLLGSPATDIAQVNPKSGCLMKIFLAFSVYSNGKKLLSTKKTPGTLGAVNGVRVLSISWVILGHVFAFVISVVSNIGYSYTIDIKKRSYQVIMNAFVSVDSFFLLSGLLVSYLLLKELKRNDGKISWCRFMAKFYFHRYWRLTPALMLLMFVYVPLFPYVSDGPFWPQQGFEPGQCNQTWWYNMLYINNFFNEECMAWTWYLANDMQFYILSPLIIIPMYYSKYIGWIIGTTILLGSWIATGLISNTYKLPASQLEQISSQESMQMHYFNDYYIKPYCRIGPYIMGIWCGYFLFKTDCKLKINKVLNLFLWMVAATLACLIVYGLYDDINGNVQLAQGVKDLYNTTHRTVWGACLGWVVFACATGNGGFVNTLLSWSFFTPLARLTYCAYLIHPILIYYYYTSLRSALYMDDATLAVLFAAAMVFTYMGAFVLSLAFEAPMLALEKIILKSDSSRQERDATSVSKHME
ncbi:O-acyltransferase like protein-like [Crassostrea virginica]|uniref:O-acyltransferase like protein-like isoform X1 n=2 Tax=Crassostrea virginica TaxID=6565 RepID=A0A8B8DD20_CRAVI|nr:O-acyltransferase like protein-like isoform X1 [Crassostrea virginica]